MLTNVHQNLGGMSSQGNWQMTSIALIRTSYDSNYFLKYMLVCKKEINGQISKGQGGPVQHRKFVTNSGAMQLRLL